MPGINPATLTLSFPDLTDPSNFTFNSGDLTQFMGFNGLSYQTVLGYLENLPTMLQNLAGPKRWADRWRFSVPASGRR